MKRRGLIALPGGTAARPFIGLAQQGQRFRRKADMPAHKLKCGVGPIVRSAYLRTKYQLKNKALSGHEIALRIKKAI